MNWKTNNIYVDGDTGEIISLEEAKKAYVIIKKIKTHDTNQAKTNGVREIRNICKRAYERELFDNDE